LKLGAPVQGGENHGVLVTIQWRVYIASKKTIWYDFKPIEGEHGYAPDDPRRNGAIMDPEARQRLIIDTGPRAVSCTDKRAARFDSDGEDVCAPTFPSPLEPCSIDTLGYIDLESPSWCIVGYPAYVPEIPDMITTDEAQEDVRIRQLATRTDVFGAAGTFHQPQSIDAGTPRRWRSGALARPAPLITRPSGAGRTARSGSAGHRYNHRRIE